MSGALQSKHCEGSFSGCELDDGRADLCVVVQISENNEQHVKGSFPLLPSSVGQGEEPLHGPAVSRGATTKFAISKNPNDTKHSKWHNLDQGWANPCPSNQLILAIWFVPLCTFTCGRSAPKSKWSPRLRVYGILFLFIVLANQSALEMTIIKQLSSPFSCILPTLWYVIDLPGAAGPHYE